MILTIKYVGHSYGWHRMFSLICFYIEVRLFEQSGHFPWDCVNDETTLGGSMQ